MNRPRALTAGMRALRRYRVTIAGTCIFLLSVSAGLDRAAAESVGDLARSLNLILFDNETPAPDFELDFLSGDRKSLSSYRGKVVFLNFWATWCPPCREEMPSMQRLHERFRDEGLAVLALNLQESAADVDDFAEEFGLTFEFPLDRTGKVGSLYGVRNIPTTYIVNRNGLVIAGAIGARDWASEIAFRYFEQILAD